MRHWRNTGTVLAADPGVVIVFSNDGLTNSTHRSCARQFAIEID